MKTTLIRITYNAQDEHPETAITEERLVTTEDRDDLETYLKALPKVQPYLGWDGQVYPQFRIETETQQVSDARQRAEHERRVEAVRAELGRGDSIDDIGLRRALEILTAPHVRGDETMKPLFEAYQLEELQAAREYIDREWQCRNAHMVHRTVEFNGQGATFLGLTHDTDSVCAVIMPFGEPYIRLVHFSAVKPFPPTETKDG